MSETWFLAGVRGVEYLHSLRDQFDKEHSISNRPTSQRTLVPEALAGWRAGVTARNEHQLNSVRAPGAVGVGYLRAREG